MTVADLVFDASAVIRGLTRGGEAAELFDQLGKRSTVGHAPDVIVAEVANAFALAVRFKRRSLVNAVRLFELFARSPIELHPTKPIAPHAIVVAAERGLTAYDAFYAVLSATLEMPLVTADRRLAAAVPGAVLVD